MTVFGAGATVGFLLPYSRLHESEADRIGLILMARPRQNSLGSIFKPFGFNSARTTLIRFALIESRLGRRHES